MSLYAVDVSVRIQTVNVQEMLSPPEPGDGEQPISRIDLIASRQPVAALEAATERRIATIARNDLPCFIRPCLAVRVTAA